jgi:hypothetical protein
MGVLNRYARGKNPCNGDTPVRKILLTLVAATAAISTSTLPSRALEQPIIDTIYRPAIDGSPTVDQVRYVCTHWYNGRWHYRQHCYWEPNRRHHRWWQY